MWLALPSYRISPNRKTRTTTYTTHSIFYLRCTSTLTSSRSSENCNSCVQRPNIMRSASRPYKQCRVFGLYAGSAFKYRMYSMILCSPSPGVCKTRWLDWYCTVTAHSFWHPYLMPAQYNRAVLPSNVIRYFRFDKMFQGLLQTHHKLGARRDAITVESRFFRQFFALLLGLLYQILCIFGRSKSARHQSKQ